MQVTQKKGSHTGEFDFGAETISHRMEDATGSIEFTVDYDDVEFGHTTLKEKSTQLKWFAWIGLVGGTVALILWIGLLIFAPDREVSIPIAVILLPVSIGMMLRARANANAYTVLETPRGKLFVLKDDQHDRVIEEIETRRRAQYRVRHMDVNLESDPQQELRRHKTLHDLGVITDEELQQAETALADESVTVTSNETRH